MERKRVIDMTLEEMSIYSFEELDRMMTEDYEYAVKQMKQEYDVARQQMIERITKVRINSCNKKDELPSIRFDLSHARNIVNIIRDQISKNENSGLIDYKYLPDSSADKLYIYPVETLRKDQVGGFAINNKYGDMLHSVILYSDGTVFYTHYIPQHAANEVYEYYNLRWSKRCWSIPADKVWDLIPKR